MNLDSQLLNLEPRTSIPHFSTRQGQWHRQRLLNSYPLNPEPLTLNLKTRPYPGKSDGIDQDVRPNGPSARSQNTLLNHSSPINLNSMILKSIILHRTPQSPNQARAMASTKTSDAQRDMLVTVISEVHPAPCTLHPRMCAPHPTPYALYPTLFTRHLTP